jgi:hypothetical protein
MGMNKKVIWTVAALLLAAIVYVAKPYEYITANRCTDDLGNAVPCTKATTKSDELAFYRTCVDDLGNAVPCPKVKAK